MSQNSGVIYQNICENPDKCVTNKHSNWGQMADWNVAQFNTAFKILNGRVFFDLINLQLQ